MERKRAPLTSGNSSYVQEVRTTADTSVVTNSVRWSAIPEQFSEDQSPFVGLAPTVENRANSATILIPVCRTYHD